MTLRNRSIRKRRTDGVPARDVVELPSRLRAQILKHAATACPEEACGILIGNETAGRVQVVHALGCANDAPPKERTRRFEIDPRTVLNVQRALRSTGIAVVGFYHSHPDSPAEPSPTDLEFIPLWPDAVWLIAGTDTTRRRVPQPQLRAWRVADTAGAVRELSLASRDLPARMAAASQPRKRPEERT